MLNISAPATAAPRADLILAHGAGAPMDSPFMTGLTAALVHHGIRVARFEFPYMAARREGGPKRPPPKVDTLIADYHAAITAYQPVAPLFIGGKSMGGRVASLVATAPPDAVQGVIAFGYPFHPPKAPTKLRTDHLTRLTVPIQIVQGTRDPLGTQDLVQGLELPENVNLHWLPGGDHDFGLKRQHDALTHAPFNDAALAAVRFIQTTLERSKRQRL